MKASVLGIAVVTAATCPADMLLIIAVGTAGLVLLIVCSGIALPAVWSAKPARRRAAAAVLRQILNACTPAKRREVMLTEGKAIRYGVGNSRHAP
jgi:hypothetical protein